MTCKNLTTIYASDSFVTTNISEGVRMFDNCTSLVGGNGTAYSDDHIDYTYALIDTPEAPGYFTHISDKPEE